MIHSRILDMTCVSMVLLLTLVVTVSANPVIDSVSPAQGTTLGGDTITITGTEFGGLDYIDFGTATYRVSVSRVEWWTPTEIVLKSPPHPEGTVDIIVGASTGRNAPAPADRFTYIAPPAITGISPTTGSTLGGTEVTITGTKFTGATAVYFGSTKNVSSFTSFSDTQIVLNAPAHAAGTYDITVTTPQYTSAVHSADRFTYMNPPSITSVSPAQGSTLGGTAVQITGTGFTGATAVRFGTQAATGFVVHSDTSITATSPAHAAGMQDITVTTPIASSAVIPADQFTFRIPPSITGIFPASGPTTGGNPVTITGTGFTDATVVMFTNSAALSFTVKSDTEIIAIAPPHTAGTRDITVTTPVGTSAVVAADKYTWYVAPVPVITGLSPAAGSTFGGETVTITGTGFIGVTDVYFGGTVVTGFTSVTDTQIVLNSPAGSAGTVDVRVKTSGGTSVVVPADQFTYVRPAPVVTGITPSTGQNTTTINILNLAGTGFYGTPAVTLMRSGKPNITATGVNVVGSTKVTCTFDLAGQPVGLWDVVVTTPDGQEAKLINGFMITASPIGRDIGVIRSSQWILDYGIDGTVNRRFNYGVATDIPVGGDFNNDGTMDIGVLRSGQWILDYKADRIVDRRFQYGLATDTPLVGDFNNDGTMDIGVFRSGEWILDYGMDRTVNRRFQYGLATDIPVIGYFNNDGIMDIGVFRSGEWILDYGMDRTVNRRFQYGLSTDTPLVSDFNNDGATDIGVFRSGQWILDYGIDRTANRRFNYGIATDIPIVGKWVTPAPVVTGISPATGSTLGGTEVTITGTVFTGVTDVYFGLTDVTSFKSVSDTQIILNSPPGSAGMVDITVKTPAGTSAVVTADRFTYITPPVVAGISPASGSTLGGDEVTITGTGFTGVTDVYFGSTNVTSFTSVSDTQIILDTPPGSAGMVSVTVVTPGGTSVVLPADHFMYVAAPSFTTITPDSGPTDGGTSIIITGTDFVDGGSFGVTIGGAAADNVVWVSATEITADTPPGTAGAQDVVITNNDGQTVTGPGAFTYIAPPAFTSITPESGPAKGGTSVTIIGTNFVDGGSFGVTIGGEEATDVDRVSSTLIIATTPAHTAGVVDVIITNNDGQTVTGTGEFRYVGAPTFTSITPESGPVTGGTSVTIIGTNFVGGGSFGVTIGGAAATDVDRVSSTRITATTPAGTAGARDVVITNNDGQTVTGSDEFRYVGGPTFTGIVPDSGPTGGGTSVTITGTNFVGGGSFGVTIGGAAADNVVWVSATEITADTPPGTAGSRNVVITNNDGQTVTGTGAFTYIAPPTFIGIGPDSGPAAGGTSVTITGTNFVGGGSFGVTIGGAAADNVVWVSATEITADTPPGTAGSRNVVITNNDGQTVTGTGAFTYIAPPTFIGIGPDSGPATGGTSVTITGTNFVGGGSFGVTIGGAAADNVVWVSATEITADTPPGTAGSRNVVITNNDGQTVTGTGAFTYIAPPTFIGIVPDSGPAAGGTSVTITGTNFVDGGSFGVTIGGAAADNVVWVSATEITADTPPGTAGSRNVVITNNDGQMVTGPGAFTYIE